MRLFIFEGVYPVPGGVAHAVVLAEDQPAAREHLFSALIALGMPPLDPDVEPDQVKEAPCLEFLEFYE